MSYEFAHKVSRDVGIVQDSQLNDAPYFSCSCELFGLGDVDLNTMMARVSTRCEMNRRTESHTLFGRVSSLLGVKRRREDE